MNNTEYYKIIIKNIFKENSRLEEAYGVLEHSQLRELLTNKLIYVLNGKEFNEEDFKESNSELIGLNIRKSNPEEISLYLRFSPRFEIEEKVDSINNISKGINYELNINKVKMLKK